MRSLIEIYRRFFGGLKLVLLLGLFLVAAESSVPYIVAALGRYTVDEVLHFCVTNMPGAVPRTASQALSAALIPYVQRLTEPDWEQDPALVEGINVRAGEYVNPDVRQELT